MLEPIVCPAVQPVPPWMRETLHDLCQPLMALECQLYLASLEVENETQRDLSAQRAMFESALHQCQRMIRLIRAAQMQMANADQMISETVEGRLR